jgi:hypothetical protein
MARVLTAKASSGRLRWVSLTTIKFIDFAGTSNGRNGPHFTINQKN